MLNPRPDDEEIFDPSSYLPPNYDPIADFEDDDRDDAQPSNVEVARRLAEAGVFVHPCNANKAPTIAWGAEADRRGVGSSHNPSVIDAWWRIHRGAVPGVNTGKCRLIVVDCDRKPGQPDGVEAFLTLAAGHGGVPDGCPIVSTPSGGRHIYFRLPDGFLHGNGTGALPGGIDIRGVGGQVIAPGAHLPDGRRWQRAEGAPDLAAAFAAGSIPEIPSWLADILRATKERDNRQPTPPTPREPLREPAPTTESNDARLRAWALAALKGCADDLASMGKDSGRNNALNNSAMRLGSMSAYSLLAKQEVYSALWASGLANGMVREDGRRQFSTTFESGFNAGLRSPCQLPEREDDHAVAEMAEAIGRRIEEADDGTLFDPQTGEIIEAKPSGAPSKREPARIAKEQDIKPTPYSWPEPSSIPPREWLFGYHYIRGFIGVTGASGGVGKSQLTIAEAASMVSWRALLSGVKPVEPLNVWIWNGEDPLHELNRRVAATMKRYGIKREDCRGQLFVDSGRNTKIIIAKAEKSGLTIARPVVDKIKARIREDEIDVLIIDPFIKSHMVNENDNSAIDAVASEWADIAEQTNCAIELVHHVRKVGDFEVTVEAMRGASALVSAARSARVLNPMTDEDGKKAGVDNRRAYFRINDGKANMSLAPEKATWFRMESVNLQNRGPYEDGDSIGVVTDWKWPDPLEEVTAADLANVQSAVSKGEWRENAQAKDWVGRAVAEALELDLSDEQVKSKIKGLLKIWIKNGALIVVEDKDENRKVRTFVKCGKAPNDDDEIFDPKAHL